ncbi:phage antirepressor N-terminal domain-containing protein [Citrobacter braakii]|uniref:phage antirepressor N-terminal domain-containing protein n=1 Tax=Citrobacter braakii TaxID=57706 RepID=UPI0040390110
MNTLALKQNHCTISVPFHGTDLFVVNHNGEPYTPMKPIVEGMGMDWMGQYTKLKQRFAKGIEEISIPTSGGMQKMICLALRKLNGWLNTISPNKVKPEIRDRVIQYQEECDDVLYEYWTKGQVVNPRKAVKTQPGKITAVQQFAIKEMVMSRGQALPKDKQAKAIITMWSALKSHFGVSYKNIDAGQFNEAVSLVARTPLEGELIPAGSVPAEETLSVKMLDAIREAIKSQTKRYGAPLKPNYREHIHSPEGVLGLTEHSLMMNLLRQLDSDGHDVEGAVAEFTAMVSYIVGASKCLRDIQTHAQYINSMAGKF